MARIVGKDAMPPRQQVVLLCAELINEAFLRQSAYSPTDRYCSPERQTTMMKLLARFVELAEAAVAAGVEAAQLAHLPVYRRLTRMGEDLPEEALSEYEKLGTELEQAFTKLRTPDGHAADR